MSTFGLISQFGAGSDLANQLMADGHTVVGFDYDPNSRRSMADSGIVMTSSVRAVLLHLPPQKEIYVVMPEGERKDSLKNQLAEWLGAGDRVTWK